MVIEMDSQSKKNSVFGDVMDDKPAWYAAMNGVQYAASIDPIECPKCHYTIITYSTNNRGEMSISSALTDKFNLQERVRKYLKKLTGLHLTIPVSDIAHDLNMTEECVISILESWNMELDEEERYLE